MRTLSSTLLAAQKAASHVPYVQLKAANRVNGLVRLDWERLYSGVEDDYLHALAIPGDGSLIRARITLPADGRKLYSQRVATPGPGSDFGTWTYTNHYNCLAVAAASNGAEVSIFWVNSSREIRRIKSTDYGTTWASAELIDYSPTTAINGLAAAYTPGGDLALFFADQAALYVKKFAEGTWQSTTSWDKTTGDLSGVAVVYDSDWDLLVTGQDAEGNLKLWSLVYGDGGEVSTGTWSGLNEMASAPANDDYAYLAPFVDKPDVFRCFFTEKFTGSEAYAQPFCSHSIPETGFVDSGWLEPMPFDLSSEYGLALAHSPADDYCWLSNANGVWRAGLGLQQTDLSADVLSLEITIAERTGSLVAELRNDDGRYASLAGPLAVGCELSVEPGYVTGAGIEVSAGLAFTLEAYQYTSAQGKASLVLEALDGWQRLADWSARHSFRWNKSTDERNVKEILAFVLGRVGLGIEVKSQSAALTAYYPDFTISPGDRGSTIIGRLLSFVPDVLFVEGSNAYVVNPLASDSSLYSYGTSHTILGGTYRQGAASTSRAQVEGYDAATDSPIIADATKWEAVHAGFDRLAAVRDGNLCTASLVEDRAEAILRKSTVGSAAGRMLVHPNCGQQVYDVIDLTDLRAGLDATKRRVLGLDLMFKPSSGRYEQRITLGEI